MNDTIKKTTILKAPLAKVWKAISDSAAFGTWFGMKLEGPFVEGETVFGAIAVTQVDDAIAKYQEPYVGVRCELRIERIVPLQLLAFRWHPGVDPDAGPDAPLERYRAAVPAKPDRQVRPHQAACDTGR